MTARAAYLFIPLSALLVACGGADEGRPERPQISAAEVVDPCDVFEQFEQEGWEFQAIADFERPEGETLPKWRLQCAPPFECGFWFNYDSVLTPLKGSACAAAAGFEVADPGMNTPFASPLPEPRCGSSETAYHLIASDIAICVNEETFRQGWGATLQLTFNPNMGDSARADPPLDASEWDGIAFWLKRGDQPSNSALLASAKDLTTAGQGGECVTDATAADAEKCDAFGKAVLMGPEWGFVVLPFSAMRQKGFGVPSFTGVLDPATLVGLEIGVSAGSWDLWFDDLSFYRHPR